jgi:SAM-dependent methyltransferase
MSKTLSERLAAPLAQPILASECTGKGRPPERVEHPLVDAEKDSFLNLLADIELCSLGDDRSHIVTRYQAWIRRNSAVSTILFAAWFNLGVELAGVGDRTSAIEAYHNSLALEPGFQPAALNLAVLLKAAGQIEPGASIWRQAPQAKESHTTLMEQKDTAKVLHVGCGIYAREKLPPMFRDAGWREIRLDIDPEVCPDFVASITDMRVISDGFIDAVYSSHNIEHLYPHEVPLALQEMRRVLKSNGFVFITLPDLQEVARHVAEGNLEDPLYTSTMGPIAPLDILYGHRTSLARGNGFMAHHTGFSSGTLGSAFIKAGFAALLVQRDSFCLTAIAFRSRPGEDDVARAQAQMMADRPAVLYTIKAQTAGPR